MSDLKHKTAEELRREIVVLESMISCAKDEGERARMEQRLVCARSYLMIKEGL